MWYFTIILKLYSPSQLPGDLFKKRFWFRSLSQTGWCSEIFEFLASSQGRLQSLGLQFQRQSFVRNLTSSLFCYSNLVRGTLQQIPFYQVSRGGAQRGQVFSLGSSCWREGGREGGQSQNQVSAPRCALSVSDTSFPGGGVRFTSELSFLCEKVGELLPALRPGGFATFWSDYILCLFLGASWALCFLSSCETNFNTDFPPREWLVEFVWLIRGSWPNHG